MDRVHGFAAMGARTSTCLTARWNESVVEARVSHA